MRDYLTPPELVAQLLAPMPLKRFYDAVKPGGDLDRAGFPAPVPWAAGRKKRYSRHAVETWKQAVDIASLARTPVDLGSSSVDVAAGSVVPFPAGGADGWVAWCLRQAERG